jgi:hypothetical protein
VIAKPINADELRLRTRWLMELKSAHDGLRQKTMRLEGSVDRAVTELRTALEGMSEAKRRLYDAHLDTIRRLTLAAEYKDEKLAHAAGHSPGFVEMIRHAAPMHDVGKIGIPDEILLKKGELTDVERALMRSHTRIGADLLAGSDSEVIQMGAHRGGSTHLRDRRLLRRVDHGAAVPRRAAEGRSGRSDEALVGHGLRSRAPRRVLTVPAGDRADRAAALRRDDARPVSPRPRAATPANPRTSPPPGCRPRYAWPKGS